MTATTTQATTTTTPAVRWVHQIPSLENLMAQEELALSYVEEARRQMHWAQHQVADVRGWMKDFYTPEEIQQARKEGWGVIRD